MRTRSTTSRQNRSFLPPAASCRVRLLRAVRRTARAPGSLLQVYEAAKESVAEGSLVPFKAALDSGCGINATVRGCAHAKHGMGGERQTRGTWHAGAAVSAGRGVVAGGGVQQVTFVRIVRRMFRRAGLAQLLWGHPEGCLLRQSFVSPRLGVPCLAVPTSSFDAAAPPAAASGPG